MITLHRHKNSPKGEEIEQKMQDLVLAYRVETLPDEDSGPFIVDGSHKIKGDSNLEDWLQQLEDELEWQRSITGDGCYMDPKTGEVC